MDKNRSRAAPEAISYDTDVLIWYFRGDEGARRFLEQTPRSRRAISSLVFMELLQGCRNRDEVGVVKAFVLRNIAAILHPNGSVSRTALGLLEKHASSDGLRVVDAMIAAACLEEGYALASGNEKHYRSIQGLKLISFRR